MKFAISSRPERNKHQQNDAETKTMSSDHRGASRGEKLIQISFRCDFCSEVQTPGTLQECQSCKLIAYCSKDCQVKHWKQEHKHECEEFQQARKAGRGEACALSRRARVKRAQRYQDLGKYKSAEKEWREIIDNEAESRSSDHMNLAFALKSQGKLQEAVDCFRKAALETNNSQAFAQLGETLGCLGKHKEAIEAIERALNIGLDANYCSVTHIFMALGDNLCRLDKLEEAVLAYEESLEIAQQEIEWSPHHAQMILKRRVQAQDSIGSSLLKLKKWDEAAFFLQKALEGFSEIFGETGPLCTYQNLGKALFNSGKIFEASKAFRQADSLYPDDPAVLHGLGHCLWFEGDSLVATGVGRVPIKTFQGYLRKLLEAQKLFKKAMELDPDPSVFQTQEKKLMDVERLNHEVTKARAQFETMVRNNILLT